MKQLNEPRLSLPGRTFPTAARAGLLLGIGLAGLLDGAIARQIFGLHRPMGEQPFDIFESPRTSMVRDGVFQAAMWLITLLGIRLALQEKWKNPDADVLACHAAMWVGAGLFIVSESVVNHYILERHHLVTGHPWQMVFDLVFIGVGVGMMCWGSILFQRHFPFILFRADKKEKR